MNTQELLEVIRDTTTSQQGALLVPGATWVRPDRRVLLVPKGKWVGMALLESMASRDPQAMCS